VCAAPRETARWTLGNSPLLLPKQTVRSILEGRRREERQMRSIDAVEVERLVAEGAQVVDVLPRDEFEEQHLPGAVSIPLKQLDGSSVAPLERDRPVIVYCHDYQ